MHDNLHNLGLDVLEVVNYRSMLGHQNPAEGSIEAPLTALAELQRKGLVRHIGLSTVTPGQIVEGRRICEIVCVQNHYNLVRRTDEAMIDGLARDGVAYVPYFPLGGFTPLQSSTLSAVAARLGATPMQVGSPGFSAARPTSTPSPERVRSRICAKILLQPNWNCRRTRCSNWRQSPARRCNNGSSSPAAANAC